MDPRETAPHAKFSTEYPAKKKSQTYPTLRVIWPTDGNSGVLLNHSSEPSNGRVVFARRRFYNRGVIEVDAMIWGLNRFIFFKKKFNIKQRWWES